MSPVRAALRNLFSLSRPYRALIRVFQIPGAYAPGYFLSPSWGSRAPCVPAVEDSNRVETATLGGGRLHKTSERS